MRTLNGKEISEFVKSRQLRQVRGLIQAEDIKPKLAIVKTGDNSNPVIDTYVRLKQSYGEDILVTAEIFTVNQEDILSAIDNLNADEDVHGIIVQLPLADEAQTDEVVARIDTAKDVDGMTGGASSYDPATAVAVNWLLAAYNIDLPKKKIAIVGHGRLVGEPLTRMWLDSGYDVTVFDKDDGKSLDELINFDVVVSATGQPGIIKSEMLKQGAVGVDAGTASQGSHIVGDFDSSVRERDDLITTPVKGGVGPLTVAALFDNVIISARKQAADKNSSED